MPWSMLWPLLIMLLGFGLFYLSVMLMRARCELLRRERKTQWVSQLLGEVIMQYAEYIWGCYFLTGIFMGYHLIGAYREHRRLIRSHQE